VDRLSVREVRTLVLLREQGPLALSELAYTLNIAPSTVHGMMLKLQALGLVIRNEAKQYIITNAGEQALAKIQAILSVEA